MPDHFRSVVSLLGRWTLSPLKIKATQSQQDSIDLGYVSALDHERGQGPPSQQRDYSSLNLAFELNSSLNCGDRVHLPDSEITNAISSTGT